jgi:autotransporter passenger strand-loop-strand repeat protein
MTTYTLSGSGPFNGGIVTSGNTLNLTAGQTIINFDVFGTVQVINNSIASRTIIENGGELLDAFGSLSQQTTVNSGGIVVDQGSVTSTTISSGGEQLVSSLPTHLAFAGNTLIAGGTQIVQHGFVRSTTVSSGGFDLVSSGGTSSNSIIAAGGFEYVYSSGVAVSATILSGGAEDIFSGGTASATIINSRGVEVVYSDGATISSMVSNGGFEVVSSGGMANAATVLSGGAEYIYSGGYASGATVSSGAFAVLSGGTLELQNGAVVSGTIVFAGSGGTLQIDGLTMPGGVINGFSAGNTIDLPNVPFDSSGFAALVAGLALGDDTTLKIQENGSASSLDFGQFANVKNQSFYLSADAQGGTKVQLLPGVAGFDQSDYPGNAVMAALWQNTNLSWVGYYLYPAPSRSSNHVQWMGHRATLAAQGWHIAPIYVGQQDPLDPDPAQKNPSTSAGMSDGTKTISEVTSEGFSLGTTVYLDIEFTPGGVLGSNTLNYISSWCSTVTSGGFTAGVYCTNAQATAISQAVPTAPLWITSPNLSMPANTSIFPTPAPSESGFTAAQVYQYQLQYNIVTPNVSLPNVDLDSILKPTQTTYAIASQQTVSNFVVNANQVLNVLSLGVSNNATVDNAGVLNVSSEGVSNNA